jgi:predicted transcriptional regulator
MRNAPSVERIVLRITMTIHIPDDLASALEGVAVAQRKSAEQVALDSLRSLFDRASSPEIVLQTVRALPHPSAAAVDDLEAAIASGRLPVSDMGAFDKWQAE